MLSKNILFFGSIVLLLESSSTSPTGRIVGGKDASRGEFPHQISLRLNNSHICGGSIISNRMILTAAHCVVDDDGLSPYPNRYFSIRAGSINRLAGGVVVGVKKITIHENYKPNYEKNDIAILELSKPLSFSKTIRAIDVANREVPFNKTVTISGWGSLGNNKGGPIYLQHNQLYAVRSKSWCRQTEETEDCLLCLAHSPNNGACFGDSGGPAVYRDEVVGVAGFVVGGCGSANPDGYAKVLHHVSWIRKHAKI